MLRDLSSNSSRSVRWDARWPANRKEQYFIALKTTALSVVRSWGMPRKDGTWQITPSYIWPSHFVACSLEMDMLRRDHVWLWDLVTQAYTPAGSRSPKKRGEFARQSFLMDRLMIWVSTGQKDIFHVVDQFLIFWHQPWGVQWRKHRSK